MVPSAQWVANLLRPDAFPHPAAAPVCIETHISWVILAGEHAYKLKKPLNLGFLDYSTLERRRVCYEAELRLNRRTAGELYLDVVEIRGTEVRPHVGGDGPVLDYAVHMRRFDQDELLAERLDKGGLGAGDIDRVAAHVAVFHAEAAIADAASGFGSVAAVRDPVVQNFAQIRERIDSPEALAILKEVEAWSDAQGTALAPVFARRLAGGRVRECHGDLHLGNLVLHRGEPRLFDAIEFNAALRWTDVMADAAFLFMDLAARERPDLAYRFLNGYLERSGDYEGLAVLRYYVVYRAMVRAKIAAIRLGQVDAAKREAERAAFDRYLALARATTRPRRSALLITCGLSGSGKTTATEGLIEARGVIRVRSDVERKRLFGLPPEARTGASADGGIYSEAAGDRTYSRLAEHAREIVTAGWPVLIDATFLGYVRRERFRALASELGAGFAILHCDAPPEVLRDRVSRRAAAGSDASEADLAVLASQHERFEPPDGDESARTLRIRTDRPVDWTRLLSSLDGLTGGFGAAGSEG